MVSTPEGAAESRASVPAAGPSRLPPWLRWLSFAGWSAAVLVAASLVAPWVSLPATLAFALGFCAVAGSALGAALLTPPVSPRQLTLVVLPAGLLGLLAQLGSEPRLDLAVGVTVALLLGGSLLGGCVGRAVEHPGQLLFVALVSSSADVFSVFHPQGPSAAIAQSEAALSLLALPWPLLGTSELGPFLGVGDVIFTALYVASGRRHGLASARTLAALAGAYAATMLVVMTLQTVVPALPLLGLAMVLAHPEARRPQERDRVRGYTVVALVVALVLLLFGL